MKNRVIFNDFRKDYLKSERNSSYIFSEKIIFSDICNLLCYEGQGDEIFLIVPSIFNSHEILTLSSPEDIITVLRKKGKVFLIEWLEIKNKNFGLSDYAYETAKVLEWCGRAHLVGHCLGGNFAIAASILRPHYIKSLILLTTPWDFSHFSAPKALYDSLGLAKAVAGFDYIPFIYMQILFFLLSPESFEQKLDFYCTNKKDIERSNFFDVERWQFSGHSIPRRTYDDLMNKFIDENILMKNLWTVDKTKVDLIELSMPIMIVTCRRDKLVPVDSLKILFDVADVYEYDTGHIGYLVGSKRMYFLKDLIKWLTSNF